MELLAPNGKPSNLPPKQYHLVRTPAFKKWFGDWENSPETASKITDNNGEPLICFHGSNNEFNEFSHKAIGSSNDMGFYGRGFYFTFQKEEKWMRFAIDEASYYGKIVKPYFIKALNPFILGELKQYKGVNINFQGTQSLVFLNNIAKKFPQIAEKITLDKKKYNPFTKENEITQVPISILPDLIDKYSKDLKIIEVQDRGETKINGYLKSKTKEVFYDNTESGGAKGSYIDFDTLSYGIDGNNKKESIEILLIEAALEKYNGIEVKYNPEGYMTRNPEITEEIKKNYDCIMQGETGDELVVFENNRMKLADTTNTTFEGGNPDVRFKDGGLTEVALEKLKRTNIKKYNSIFKNYEGFYHQTTKKSIEKIIKNGFNTKEVWLAPDENASYGEYDESTGKQYSIEVYVPRLKKPFVMDSIMADYGEYGQTENSINKNLSFYEKLGGEANPKTFDKLRQLGYDSIIEEGGDRAYLYPQKAIIDNPTFISKSYHKAKIDGSNPELVKAVENALKGTNIRFKDGGNVSKLPKEFNSNENLNKEDMPYSLIKELGESGIYEYTEKVSYKKRGNFNDGNKSFYKSIKKYAVFKIQNGELKKIRTNINKKSEAVKILKDNSNNNVIFSDGGTTKGLIEVKPNRYLYHSSNTFFRDKIKNEGLVVKGYSETWLGDTEIEGEVIFATNSSNREDWFDSTYDNDIYEIDTNLIKNKWYKDPNFLQKTYHHIITFENIPLKAIKLIYKGSQEDTKYFTSKEAKKVIHASNPNIKYKDGGQIKDLLSAQEVEDKLGRDLHWWNDDVVFIGGQKYKKVYLRPEYKRVIE
jgi:hypothetical protein